MEECCERFESVSFLEGRFGAVGQVWRSEGGQKIPSCPRDRSGDTAFQNTYLLHRGTYESGTLWF